MKMYIKEVRINNYKTYRNTRIKFHPQLNIVVGPNGSGKSNLIEAILYGLGERSMKIFRAYKYRDLLPADSRNSAKVLSVTLVIEDGHGNEHIFRRVYNAQTNTHAYYYNRRRVSRGVYISKLATLGYKGLHHVYIPQGGIISRANITSRDLKDIVDEALGIKEFNQKKQEALEKLEKAEAKLENIKEKQEIMRDVIDRLMAQMIAYDRKRNIERISKRVKAYILTKENLELKPRLDKYNDKLSRVRRLQEKLSNRLDKIEDKIGKIDVRIKKLREKLREREEYQALLRRRSEVKTEIDISENRISILERDKERLLNDINKIDLDLARIKEEVLVYSMTIKELNQATKRIDSDIRSLTKEKTRLEEEVEKLRNKLDELIAEKQRLDKEKTDMIKREIKAEAEKLAIKKIRDIYIDKKKEMEDKRRKYRETIRRFEERIELLNKKKEELENRLRKLRRERDSIDTKYKEIKREIRDAEKLLNKVERYIERIRREEETRNLIYKNNAEYILKVAKDMNLKGVVGILAELVDGPKEIINILSRYMGREWYSIIVYDEDTARKVFKLTESLKKRVIIKPLTRHISSDREAHERSVVNILRIRHYKRLRPLINSLFGQLILTSDLDEGLKYLEKGYGIISKKGDFIIAPDNWIYEGRRKIVIDEDISKIEDIYNQFKKMIQIRRDDLDKYGEKREAVIEEIADLTSEYARLKQSIDLIKTSLGYIKDMERFYKRKVKEIDRELDKVKLKTEKKEDEVSIIARVENEINTIHKSIIEKTNQISEIDAKINELIRTKNKNEATIELNKKSIAAIKERKERLRDKRRELKDNIKKIDKEIRELNSKIKTLTRQMQELDTDIERYNQEIKTLEDKIDKLNKVKDQLYEKWKKTNEKLSDLKRMETKLSITIRSIRNKLRENEDTILRLGYTIDELSVDGVDVERLREIEKEIGEQEEELGIEGYYPSPTAYIDYKEKYEPYKLFTINKAKLEEEREAILNFIKEIEEEKEKTFKEGFAKIKEKFTRLIKHVFPDSEVYMDLEDPDDIDSGLAVYVRLRDKPQLPIISASGGEKSLFIILFLLAVYSLPGNVVFLLDEIDAHIDPRNLNKFASALSLQKTESQIIYVTLPRDEALPRVSDHLIGIFFRRGVSRPVVIPNTELSKVIR